MSLISASARRRVAGFFGAMTQRPSQVRSSRQYQTLSAPVTGRLLALQSTIKYASNSDMAATAYGRPLQQITRMSICRSRSILTRTILVATGIAVHPTRWYRRNGCKPEPTDNAPASSKASRKFQRGFVRRQTTTLQLQHFPIEIPAQFLTPLDTYVVAHRNNFLNKAKLAPPQSHHHTAVGQFDPAASRFQLSSPLPLPGTAKLGVVNFKWLGYSGLRGGGSGQTWLNTRAITGQTRFRGCRPNGKPAWSAHRPLPGLPAPSWEDRSRVRSVPAGVFAKAAV